MLEKLTKPDIERIWRIERKVNRIDNDLNNMIGNFLELKSRVERIENMIRYIERSKA